MNEPTPLIRSPEPLNEIPSGKVGAVQWHFSTLSNKGLRLLLKAETCGRFVAGLSDEIEPVSVCLRGPFFAHRLRRRLISAAERTPSRLHPNRTVPWLTSMPRSCSASPTFRSESAKRMSIITA